MCGIAGIFATPRDSMEVDAFNMRQALNHRGPDDWGIWGDNTLGIWLTQRRLAVVDLSPAGHQPMISHCGRYIAVFNGEIYNHLAIREELERAFPTLSWRGRSDTETLLAAVERWGLDIALAKTVGMFALAVWDRVSRSLYLARDRLGEKPLYYGWVGSEFVFASELKAFKVLNAFDGKVCRRALSLYMQHSNVPAPYTIYQGIYKLEPGCVLRVSEPKGAFPKEPPRAPSNFSHLHLYRWWDLAHVRTLGYENLIEDENEAIEALDDLLTNSIDLQSLADVPVGAFLSGGVDSALVVALMQQRALRRVQTFTVGFEEYDFDESSYARAVSRHLGTEHTELTVNSADAIGLIPKLAGIYDEPFADSSQIPTFLVSKLARSRVTVALTGDGGDEFFGGYDHYVSGARIWSLFSRVPYPARRIFGQLLIKSPTRISEIVEGVLKTVFPRNRQVDRLAGKFETLGAMLSSSRNVSGFHRILLAKWKVPGCPVLSMNQAELHEPIALTSNAEDCKRLLMFLDALDFLPNSVLCKVDRAAMANSLETRAPLLDHRVVELSCRLPLDMLFRKEGSKWALRQVLYRRIPREMFDRPKTGFSLPLASWLRGPLRDWASALLDKKTLVEQGYLDAVLILKKWEEHLSGTYDHSGRLWTVLMFQSWLESEQNSSKFLLTDG